MMHLCSVRWNKPEGSSREVIEQLPSVIKWPVWIFNISRGRWIRRFSDGKYYALSVAVEGFVIQYSHVAQRFDKIIKRTAH